MSRQNRQKHAYLLLKEISILNQLATAEFNRILPHGVHVSHFTVLEHLCSRQDGQTPQDLARVFQMSKQNMTNTVLQLEKRGFASVRPNPKDGRSKIVKVTPQGQEFREEALKLLSVFLGEITKHGSFDALNNAIPAMQDMRAFLDERRNL